MFMVTGGRAADAVRPSGVRGRLARRREERESYALAHDIAQRWRWVAEGTAVARTAPCVAGGVAVSVPTVVSVDLGPPVVLTVRLLAGQLPGDIAEQAHRLADGMGVAAVRVEPFRHGYARVTLLPVDPLAAIPVPRTVPPDTGPRIVLGRDETGRTAHLEPRSAAHTIVQGATRSGKSTALYGVLSQVAQMSHVDVTGCDPTGLLLGPWTARGGPLAPSTGTKDPAGHVALLERLTAEMDRRVSKIPPGRDVVTLGPDVPLLMVVLEEWPATLRVLDSADKTLGRLARAAVARLLSEGAKAGVRVVMVCQRADANIIGGFERGQASHRLTFRVDGPDAVRMLHQDVSADVIAGHAVAPAGVALLSAPGTPLVRLRASHVTYADYVSAVQRGAGR